MLLEPSTRRDSPDATAKQRGYGERMHQSVHRPTTSFIVNDAHGPSAEQSRLVRSAGDGEAMQFSDEWVIP